MVLVPGRSRGYSGLRFSSPCEFPKCSCWVCLSGQRPSICCRRPRCRLKAPLGLSLLRCASQTRSHPKPCRERVWQTGSCKYMFSQVLLPYHVFLNLTSNLQFYQALTFPFSTLPSKHHSNCSSALITRHGNICSYRQKSHVYSKKICSTNCKQIHKYCTNYNWKNSISTCF